MRQVSFVYETRSTRCDITECLKSKHFLSFRLLDFGLGGFGTEWVKLQSQAGYCDCDCGS